MATSKPFVGVNLPPEIVEALDDLRYNHRLRSRAEAIEIVLRAGMEMMRADYPELDLDAREKKKDDGIKHERKVYYRKERKEGDNLPDKNTIRSTEQSEILHGEYKLS